MSQSSSQKRSLFSKQALAKVSAAKDPVDFFSCAKKVYPQLLELEEEKRRNKSKVTDHQKLDQSVELKDGDPDENKNDSDFPGGPTTNADSENLLLNKRLSPSPSSSPSYKRSGRAGPPDSKRTRKDCKLISLANHDQNIISLSSEDEEAPYCKNDPFEKESPGSPSPLSSAAEYQPKIINEEYSEFIQQARERERLKTQQRLITVSQPVEQRIRSYNEKTGDIFETNCKSAADFDPTIEILITSQLEGTKPLRVKRKLSQRLKEARLTWCDRQTIKTDTSGRPLEDVVFLTWRGKRLFDATTCGSLGMKFNIDENLSQGKNGVNYNSNIHLEVWTEDALKERENPLVNQGSEVGENESLEEQSSQKEKETLCKIILKAKNIEPYKLAVRSTTSIAKIIEAFRKAKEIPESTKIVLYFDGDLLDPNSTVEETELGDPENVDTVEVYLK
ncbi:putative ubiquitin-like protein [Golovinomyces cichoracearum]|uniref:Putative ubiquitin-like protein n=1 Tax=Golovinomyces cichoracearum TaxID=62708 RepID=A0A420J5M2_9PEZI|nr:putative ubiquitin-like protein [Golovinomyces cichoracearum]